MDHSLLSIQCTVYYYKLCVSLLFALHSIKYIIMFTSHYSLDLFTDKYLVCSWYRGVIIELEFTDYSMYSVLFKTMFGLHIFPPLN